MLHSKLIRLLRIFSQEEIIQLGQFLKSPLFNDGDRPQKVMALLEYLSSLHPDFEKTALDKELIFRAVFSQESYNEAKLDKAASELSKAARKFIELCRSEETTSGHRHWLAQAQFFRQHDSDGEFRFAIEQLEKLQADATHREQDFYFRQFLLESERVKHLVRRNDRKTDINIPGAIQSLDIFYLLSKMEYCSYLLTRSAHVNLDSPQSFLLLDEVLELAKKHYLHVPVVAGYFHAFMLLLRREERTGEAFDALQSVLAQNASQFSTATLRLLQSFLRNHLAERYNRGETACLPQLVALFKEHARTQTLFQEDGTIIASTLQSAVIAALKIGEHDWATEFLQQNRHRAIGADDPAAFYRFNLANCHFHRGDFQAADQCLTDFQFRDLFYKLAARRLEIKLLYEMESPLLDARLDAFKIFIHDLKSTLSPDKIAPNNHFANLLRQIQAPKTLGNPTRIKKLMEKIEAQKAVAEREWLMQKLVGMKDKTIEKTAFAWRR